MTDEQRRPRPAAQYGPTASTVATNVQRLRKQRGLSIYQLSALLRRTGRPITPAAVGKMEREQRQVTVDDLAALAVIFGVSPAALLLPLTDAPNDRVEVTGAGEVSAEDAWAWASNERPLHLPEGDSRTVMLEYQLYGLPPSRRRTGGVWVRGERSADVLRAKREMFERMAGWGAVDLEAEKRRDPEPWEVD